MGNRSTIAAFNCKSDRFSWSKSSSWKIASTGHSATHCSQSMQHSELMYNISGPTWKQSQGQTLAQAVSLQPIQALVTTCVILYLLIFRACVQIPVSQGLAERTVFDSAFEVSFEMPLNCNKPIWKLTANPLALPLLNLQTASKTFRLQRLHTSIEELGPNPDSEIEK